MCQLPPGDLHNRRRGSSRSGLTKAIRRTRLSPKALVNCGRRRCRELARRSGRPALRPVTFARQGAAHGAAMPAPIAQAWSRPLGAAGRVEIWFVPAGAHRAAGSACQDSRPRRLVGHRPRSRRDGPQSSARDTHHPAPGAVACRRQRGEARGLAHSRPPRTANRRWLPGCRSVHFCISHIETMSVIAVSRDAAGRRRYRDNRPGLQRQADRGRSAPRASVARWQN